MGKNIVDYNDEIKGLLDALMEKCKDTGWPAMFITGTFEEEGCGAVDQLIMQVSAPDQWMPKPLEQLYKTITNEGVLHFIAEHVDDMLVISGRNEIPSCLQGKIDVSQEEMSQVIGGSTEFGNDDTIYARIAKTVVALRRKQNDQLME
jgi:hypothetical protein